jgi:hypothetical protein
MPLRGLSNQFSCVYCTVTATVAVWLIVPLVPVTVNV